jgi:hypothetical protein
MVYPEKLLKHGVIGAERRNYVRAEYHRGRSAVAEINSFLTLSRGWELQQVRMGGGGKRGKEAGTGRCSERGWRARKWRRGRVAAWSWAWCESKERRGSVDRRGVDGRVGAVRAERAGTMQGGAEGKRAGRR